MLINEFDLDLSGIDKKMRFKEEIVIEQPERFKPTFNNTSNNSRFFWFQMRDNYDYNIDDVVNDGIEYITFVMKRNRKGFNNFRKGIYRIMPNFTIVIK